MSERRALLSLAVLAFLLAGLVAGCGGPTTVDQVTDWKLVEPALSEVTQITIYVFLPGSTCHKFDRVEATETAEQVVLDAHMIWTPGDCSEDIRWDQVKVLLAAPLRERRLLGCVGGGDVFHFWKLDPSQVTDCRDLDPTNPDESIG